MSQLTKLFRIKMIKAERRPTWCRKKILDAERIPDLTERRQELLELLDALTDLNCETPHSDEMLGITSDIHDRIQELPTKTKTSGK